MTKGNWTITVLAAALPLILGSTAEARFLQTDPVGYQDDNNLYIYAHNDPTNNIDPTGKDTEVQLQSYIIGNAPIQGDYGHQYIFMRDTVTSQTVITRAGLIREAFQGRSLTRRQKILLAAPSRS
jgi:hypothetical protein